MKSRKLALLGTIAALGTVAVPVGAAVAATPHHTQAKVVHTERNSIDRSKDRTNNERGSLDRNSPDKQGTDRSSADRNTVDHKSLDRNSPDRHDS